MDDPLSLGPVSPVTHLPLCPVLMHEDRFCGRALHALSEHDRVPVCLMHSLDPAKDDTFFQLEIDSIVTASATTGIADFTRFVFPSSQYMVREFPARCIFRNAVFWKEANFYSADFELGADFEGARFEDEVTFTRCRFGGKTSFNNAVFNGDTQFTTDFMHEVAFITAHFAKEASFYHASFAEAAFFDNAEFEDEVFFSSAIFHQEAYMDRATFLQKSTFAHAAFKRDADFRSTRFTLDVDFLSTAFLKRADFTEAVFHDAAHFSETQFRHDDERVPGPIFSLAHFMAPEKILFYRTILAQALFYNCDVSRVAFSSVQWRTRPNGKRQLFEECVDLTVAQVIGPRPGDPNERDYGLIAETYQQLKKNYDSRMDYWTGGDFHYGEMEMKRLYSPSRNKAVRWLHRNLGLVAWYRYASEYGESYVRPLLMLLGVLALFTFLFPVPGMVFTGSTPPSFPRLNYGDFSSYIQAYPGPAWVAALAFFGHSLMTTLSVAGFQKELIYQPAYPWGRALALLELLLTSTLIALFLLALRRQFRR